MKSGFWAMLAGTLVLMTTISGCATSNHISTNVTDTATSPSKGKDIINAGTNNQRPKTNPLFQTTLTLPNGQIVKPNHPTSWKDLSIQLLITSLPPSLTDGYKAVVGNHSMIISHKTMSTSAGEAMLVLNERAQPAASQSTVASYEYWVIVYGSQDAYAIDATIVGNRNNAKDEIIELLNHWKVPQS